MARELAEKLVQIKALQVNVKEPFTWSSGLRSPVYCDNRLILSYPELRKEIRIWFCDLIHQYFPEARQIAAVATGAIAHGMAVANQLDWPFCYVRPKPKKHGTGQQIEGRLTDDGVVVIEDLISTGQSSLGAVRALRSEGAQVAGLAAIFSYQLPEADEGFEKNECKKVTLCDFQTLNAQLAASGALDETEAAMLAAWRENPTAWSESASVS